MKKLVLVIIIISVFCLAAFSEPVTVDEYYFGCKNLEGKELKQKLHEIIKGHVVFPYFGDGKTGVAEIMMEVDEDESNPDNIKCFYSGFSYPKSWIDFGRDKDYKSLGTTLDNSWNREHVWSKSHGFPHRDEDIAYSDVHNLRPEDRTVNSSKGDKDFDWGGFPEPEVSLCYTDKDSWEAPDRVKGDIARCLFYMAVRYEGTDTPYDLQLVEDVNTEENNYGRLSTLLEWHKLDPPDEYEERRNNIIFEKYQHNRNPFIDHPEYAFLIWGEPSYQKRLNLSDHIVHFSAIENDNSQFLDINLTAVNYYDNVKIDIEEYPEMFSITYPENAVFLLKKKFINDAFRIELNPVQKGEFTSYLLFSGFDEELEINAFILPEKGNWIVNEEFNESLSNFEQLVLQGNKRYGWHHSSWDENHFARLRGNYDEFTVRECWLISPPLAIENMSKIFLNFRSARNEAKSPEQVVCYLSASKPEDGIPPDALKINFSQPEGNYVWKNSGWLEIEAGDLSEDEIYLLFRYYYDGNEAGQETWEIDNIKIYGIK